MMIEPIWTAVGRPHCRAAKGCATLVASHRRREDVCGGRAKTTDVYGSLGFCELMCRSQFTSVSTV